MTGVYTIINKIDGKVYVGSSAKSLHIRFRVHKRELLKKSHHNQYLQNAVNKYGIENFEFEIIHECEPEFCLSFEQYWRNMLCSWDRRFGYDMCYIAGNMLGTKRTDEAKKKISISRKKYKGKNHPSWGKKLTQHTKDLISESRSGIKNINFGRYGSKHYLSKPVLQFTKDGIFINEWGGIREAGREIGMPHTHISSVCKGLVKSAGGFVWKYKE